MKQIWIYTAMLTIIAAFCFSSCGNNEKEIFKTFVFQANLDGLHEVYDNREGGESYVVDFTSFGSSKHLWFLQRRHAAGIIGPELELLFLYNDSTDFDNLVVICEQSSGVRHQRHILKERKRVTDSEKEYVLTGEREQEFWEKMGLYSDIVMLAKIDTVNFLLKKVKKQKRVEDEFKNISWEELEDSGLEGVLEPSGH